MNCFAFVVAFHIISSVMSNFHFFPDGIFTHFSVPNTLCPKIKVLTKNFNNDLLITLLHMQFFNIDVFRESSASFVWCIRLDKPVSVLMVFKLNTNYVIRFYQIFDTDVFSESVLLFDASDWAPSTRMRIHRIRNKIFSFSPPVYTNTLDKMVLYSPNTQQFEYALQSRKIWIRNDIVFVWTGAYSLKTQTLIRFATTTTKSKLTNRKQKS